MQQKAVAGPLWPEPRYRQGVSLRTLSCKHLALPLGELVSHAFTMHERKTRKDCGIWWVLDETISVSISVLCCL